MLSDEWLPRYRLLENFTAKWNGNGNGNGNAYDRDDYNSSFALRAVELKSIGVFYYFQGQFHIFKGNFTKFQDNSRTNGTILKFQEFSRTKVKFKDFSRSVRTLLRARLGAC